MRRTSGTPVETTRVTRSRRALGRALAAGALTGLAALAAIAAGQSGTTIIVPAARSAQEPPAASSVRAAVAESELPVVSVREASDWNLVIVVDPPLSTPGGLQSALRMLSDEADALVALGPVRLLTVDRGVVELLPPTSSGEELRAALSAAAAGQPAGLFTTRRREQAGATDRLDRIEFAHQELQLLRWQRESLVDWLLTAEVRGPKVLFLIEDGFDFNTEAVYGLSEGTLAGSPSPVFDDGILGVSLAAVGWTTFPIEAGAEDVTLARTDIGEPLAAATGGRPVRTAADLTTAIDRLGGALELDISLGPVPAGPLPLVLAIPDFDATPPRWVGTAFVPGRAAARARSHTLGSGSDTIPVTAAILYDGPDPDSVVIEVRADLEPGRAPPSTAWLSLALYLDQLDASPLEMELQGRAIELGGVDRWVVQCAIVLPEDPGDLVAVVTDAAGGRWGAAAVDEEIDYLARRAPGVVIEQFDLRPPSTTDEGEAEPDTAIRLIAPSGDALSGRQRFQTLVTTRDVVKTTFHLDGKQVAEDTEAPFAARIDLGRRPERHTIRVDAFDALGGLVGSDSIRLNEPMRSFEVAIASVTPTASGRLAVEARVSHPTDVTVDRVEVFYNEQRMAELSASPWTAEVTPPGPISATDYVRVVAYLNDGRFLEDVRLFASPGAGERVQVNLVQVYAVVTDRDGEPVTDLSVDDFQLRMNGEPQEVQRFAFADEVPLLLGLVIDTSPSMWALMPDTKKAAARFLTQVITDKDQALVIDFDTRPRLAAALTNDITDLLLSLGTMQAEPRGTTALYDSVIFGSLQLPAGQDRKALVLLTDGDDYKSRFGAPRAIETAKRAGVPVYVVSLAGLHDARRQFRRTELDGMTHRTGGGAYYLGAMSELGPTYDQIANELRSQYLLAFPTDRQLSEKDLESIRVTVDRPGVKLRTVVGGRSVN